MSTRISATQASVLAAMRSGHKLRYVKGRNPHCFLSNAYQQRVTQSAFALERKGMIERCNDRPSGFEFRLVEK